MLIPIQDPGINKAFNLEQKAGNQGKKESFCKFLLLFLSTNVGGRNYGSMMQCKEKLAALFIFSFERAKASKLWGRVASQRSVNTERTEGAAQALAVSTARWPQAPTKLSPWEDQFLTCFARRMWHLQESLETRKLGIQASGLIN